MDRPRDEFDEAVDYLTKNPWAIRDAFHFPETRKGGVLFRPISRSGSINQSLVNHDLTKSCGCPVQIRCSFNTSYGTTLVAFTDELTAMIGKDDRIPLDSYDIQPKHLEAFADIQRRVKYLRSIDFKERV